MCHSPLRSLHKLGSTKTILCVNTALTREKACVYQSTRPFLPCVTQLVRDGCEYLLYISSWKFPPARSWAAPVSATGTVQKRQAVRPVHHVQNHTCRVTLLQPARRAAVLGQPSSLRCLIGTITNKHEHTCSSLLIRRPHSWQSARCAQTRFIFVRVKHYQWFHNVTKQNTCH